MIHFWWNVLNLDGLQKPIRHKRQLLLHWLSLENLYEFEERVHIYRRALYPHPIYCGWNFYGACGHCQQSAGRVLFGIRCCLGRNSGSFCVLVCWWCCFLFGDIRTCFLYKVYYKKMNRPTVIKISLGALAAVSFLGSLAITLLAEGVNHDV